MIKVNFSKLISTFKIVIWDFDGVIKDSNFIKENAFIDIFDNISKSTQNKIREHHINNVGMSRFDKIPIYLNFCKLENNELNIKKYLDKFSLMVVKKVIKSDWIPGSINYISKNTNNQKFCLITSTPENEIIKILKKIKIDKYFIKIYGSPNKKKDAIRDCINTLSVDNKSSIMIGDDYSDYEASKLNNISFLLFKNIKYNKNDNKINKKYKGKYFEEF